MKKIILIALVAIFSLAQPSNASVSNIKTVSETDLPMAVQKLKAAHQFDSVLIIQTDDYTYMYSSDGRYLGKYQEDTPSNGSGLITFLFFVAMWFVILILL